MWWRRLVKGEDDRKQMVGGESDGNDAVEEGCATLLHHLVRSPLIFNYATPWTAHGVVLESARTESTFRTIKIARNSAGRAGTS